MIKITFPDGAVREFESGVTTFEIAQSISNSLAKKALAGKFNGKLIDTTRAITEDGSIEIVTPDHEDALPILRHSAAHLFAQAARRLFPDIHLGVGPAIEDGFYYDTDNTAGQISNEDLPRIEEEMKKIVKENFPSIREEVTKDEAREIFKNDPYKLELIEEHSEDEGGLTIYRQGEYVDLCRGPHVPSTGRIQIFHLLHVAGAYWRGNEKNPQMQRLYGVAFNTQEELDEYLAQLELAKQRDHRKLGKELDLYTMSPLVGVGLPLFTPRGTVLRDIMAQYSNQLRQRFGFEKVWTPHITKKDLYETSGHWAKFGEELFLVKSQETSDEMALKPMNCPHHTQIFASRPRSYRDMPVRYLETTTDYRDEKTGELGGLSRVRSLTQDDSHVFCRPDQIETEINNLLSAARELYGSINMKLRVRLSYRDESDSYLGGRELWNSAQNQLKSAVERVGLDYFEQEGEAAFYGPKIDFMATDALGREHQVATVQLDFVQPQRFGLEYTESDGNFTTPVMIH